MAARRAEPLKPRPRAPGEELSLIRAPRRKLDERVPADQEQHARRIVGQPVAGAELIPEGPVVREGEGRQVRRQVQRPGVTVMKPSAMWRAMAGSRGGPKPGAEGQEQKG